MSRIAVIITDMFEDSEYLEPAKAFKEKGHELIHVGVKAAATDRLTFLIIKKSSKGSKRNLIRPQRLNSLKL